ncbi:hypothetical protein M8C21_004887, partial [Ambrosia artemisiifolia]
IKFNHYPANGFAQQKRMKTRCRKEGEKIDLKVHNFKGAGRVTLSTYKTDEVYLSVDWLFLYVMLLIVAFVEASMNTTCQIKNYDGNIQSVVVVVYASTGKAKLELH